MRSGAGFKQNCDILHLERDPVHNNAIEAKKELDGFLETLQVLSLISQERDSMRQNERYAADQSRISTIWKKQNSLLEKCCLENLADEFLDYFPGMTCDFSDANREGFTMAIKKAIHTS